MTELTTRDRELVALGAAMGSNCVPCIEYHIPQSRQAGLTDPEIQAAIEQADKVRQVPARKVLATALGLLPCAGGEAAKTASAQGCGAAATQPAMAAAATEGCGCS
jgi:AhpD family alkylhydroperoxidase